MQVITTSQELLNLREHSRRISSVLNNIESYKWNQTANWFHVASGIRKVDYNGISNDTSIMWCRPAWEYEEAKQKIHEPLVNELIFFSFIWNGIESLIDELDLISCPNHAGKINKCCYFLKKNYDPFFPLKGYSELLIQLKSFIIKNHFDTLLSRFQLGSCVSDSGQGLYVIYKLRNMFAHGGFLFPEPEDWTFKKPYEKDIIKISSRLLLLTAQMLLIARYKEAGSKLTYIPEFDIDEIHSVSYIQKLHYSGLYFNYDQLEIGFR